MYKRQVLCNIKPGTQSGTKIRLRGKGIVAMNNPSVHGDEYATVQIEVPTNLTPEARRKLKEFEQECNGSRRSRGFGSGSAEMCIRDRVIGNFYLRTSENRKTRYGKSHTGQTVAINNPCY